MPKEEDLAWLKYLHNALWGSIDIPTPREKLSYEEVDRICDLVEEDGLVTELFPCGVICGVGMSIYAHEQYPGTGAELLLSLKETHLLGPTPPTVYERLAGKEGPSLKLPKRQPGDCDPYAWALFTKYANRPENVRWLQQYKLRPIRDKIHYDY